MPLGSLMTISSTVVLGAVLRTRPVPPMTFALPGSTCAVVMPSKRAASRPPSSALALIPSRARTWGVAGSVISLPSLSAQPTLSSRMPDGDHDPGPDGHAALGYVVEDA